MSQTDAKTDSCGVPLLAVGLFRKVRGRQCRGGKGRGTPRDRNLSPRLSAEKYDQIYDDGSLTLKTGRGASVVRSYLASVRERFGAFGSLNHAELNVVVGVPVQVRAVCNTRYERGETTELFVYLKEEGRIRLAEYQIYPGAVVPSKRSSP